MFSHAFGWIAPSVARLTYEEGGRVSSAGTAFFLRGLLITNFHVYRAPAGRDVRLKFGAGHEDIVVSDQMLHDSFVHASGEDQFDYALFNPERLYLKEEHRGLLNRLWTPLMQRPAIGDAVGIAGYPFGKPRLTAHHCRISAIFDSAGARIYQLEGSVNVSNSGGPLFSLNEQAVLGIVTRKEHGLSDRFKPMLESIQNRLNTMREDGHFGGNVAPNVRTALIETQESLQILAQELERSSNTGIGYAISLRHLIQAEQFAQAALPGPYGPGLEVWD